MKKINFLKNPFSIIILLLLIFIVILLSYNYNLSNDRKIVLEKFQSVKSSTTSSTTQSKCIQPMCSFDTIINPTFSSTPEKDKYKIDLKQISKQIIGLNQKKNGPTFELQAQSNTNLVFTIPPDKNITIDNLIMINSLTSTTSNKYMFIIILTILKGSGIGVMPVIYDSISTKDQRATQLKTFNFTDKDSLYVLNPIPDATFKNGSPATITLKNSNSNIKVGTIIILSIIISDSTSTYFIQICNVASISSSNVITLNSTLIPVVTTGSNLKCTPYILPPL